MSKIASRKQAAAGSRFSFLARRLALSVSTAIAAAVLASCGGGGDAGGGGGNPNPAQCTVTGVTVAANPGSIAPNANTTLTATVNASATCSGAVTWSVAPAGGTLTAGGTTATFVAATPGTYTVTATSSADATKAGSAAVTVTGPVACGLPNGTVVTHSANVAANETWAGDGVTHSVPFSFSITGSSIVTVEPCAIVALGQGASITVRDSAKLVAAGTGSTRFVTFRRADVNQPWGVLRNLTPTSTLDLRWTTVQGGGSFGGSYGNPAIVMSGEGYGSPPVPVLKVDNVVIDSPQGAGIYLDTNAAFTADSQQLTITGAGEYAVRATMMSLGSLPVGSYTGNAIDEIFVVGPGADVFADMTIHDRGVPVRVQTGGLRVAPRAPNTAPVTLTLEPGVVLRFPRMNAATPGARVTFGTNGSAPDNLVGVLNAIGTPAKPIVFTSGEASPAPGDWVGLWLDTANGSRLDHVEIGYAGGVNGIQSNNCRPTNTQDQAALIVGDFETQYVPPSNLITNSRIHNSAGFGIDAIWQAPAFNEPDLTASNVFENNALCRQTYNAVAPPGTCPAIRGCTAN